MTPAPEHLGDQDAVCKLETAQDLTSPSGCWVLGRDRAAPGGVCRLSAGEERCSPRGMLPVAAPRKEGRGTARRAGRPFGIWQRCAWVPRFKELSKKPSIWAPLAAAVHGGALSRWFATKQLQRRKGKEPCPKCCMWWPWLERCLLPAPGATSKGLVQGHLPRGLQQAGWAAAQCLFPCARAPVKRLTSAPSRFCSQIQPRGSGRALPVPLRRAVRSSTPMLLGTNLHPPASGGIAEVRKVEEDTLQLPGEGPGSCFAVPKSASVSLPASSFPCSLLRLAGSSLEKKLWEYRILGLQRAPKHNTGQDPLHFAGTPRHSHTATFSLFC